MTSDMHHLLHPTERYESVHDVTEKLGKWLKQEAGRHVFNIETIQTSLEAKDGEVDTTKSLQMNVTEKRDVLNCLRVWFTSVAPEGSCCANVATTSLSEQ